MRRIVSRTTPLAAGNCAHCEIGVQICNFSVVAWFHSSRVLRNPEPEEEHGGQNGDPDNGSGAGRVTRRKKLKGKRAVVRWLKLFRYKKKKSYERMTAEEKILYKLMKVDYF